VPVSGRGLERSRYVREVQRVDEEDPAVVREGPLNGDHLVEKQFVDQIRELAVFHHETWERSGSVFEFDQPVTARCRPDIVNHADDRGVGVAAHRFERIRRSVVDSAAQLSAQSLEAVAKHVDEIVVLARSRALARHIVRDLDRSVGSIAAVCAVGPLERGRRVRRPGSRLSIVRGIACHPLRFRWSIPHSVCLFRLSVSS